MISGKRLALAIGVALLTGFGSLSAAQAQYAPRPYYAPPPPPRGVYRSGLVLGGSIGFGAMSSSGCGAYCGASGMIEGHLGGMLNPRLALVGDLFAAIHTWDDGYFTGQTYNGIYTVALQYWVTDILWLKGGLGIAHLQFGYDGDVALSDETGFAALGAAGVEVLQSYNFALDVHIRVGRGFYDSGPDVTNVALMVGVNWY